MDCKNRDWFFSRKEIVNAASDLPDGENFELHRPWIDNVKIKCTKCGSTNTQREQYVLDTWHNSGSAPFSSLTDEVYSKFIPAPFFTEGIGQTRNNSSASRTFPKLLLILFPFLSRTCP